MYRPMNHLKSVTLRQFMCEKQGDIRDGMSERSRRLECFVFTTGENDDRIAAVPVRSAPGEVANQRKHITMINFRDVGRPMHGCEVVHGYIESSNLDYSRIEDICINFWPVYGCPVMLDEAQWAMDALCKICEKRLA
ncbi:MAG: hypothetical protein Q9204_002868 [Flavoplaca sp. TL-2023a]